MLRNLLAISSLGALGAGLSGLCLLHVGLPIIRNLPPSLPLAVLIEGICFMPFGASMGLSITLCSDLPKSKMIKMSLAGIAAGFIYGALAWFSIFGNMIGLICFGLSLAAGMELNSIKYAGRVVLAFFVIVVVTYFMMWGGNTIFRPLAYLLYPVVAMSATGAFSLIWIAVGGYFLNLILLVILRGNYPKLVSV